ncbi:MAG: disulfide bond formation protein B [Parvularculales bacterium]
MMHRIPSDTTLILAVALLSLATLGGAYLFEYVGGLAPCPLCLQQRIPYVVGALMTVLAWQAGGRAPMVRSLLMGLAVVAFIIGAGLGVHHSGIEWDWWAGPASCSGGGGIPLSTADLLESLKQENQIVRCDEAPWRLAGLSLAGYNVLISAGLAFLSTLVVWRYWGPTLHE